MSRLYGVGNLLARYSRVMGCPRLGIENERDAVRLKTVRPRPRPASIISVFSPMDARRTALALALLAHFALQAWLPLSYYVDRTRDPAAEFYAWRMFSTVSMLDRSLRWELTTLDPSDGRLYVAHLEEPPADMRPPADLARLPAAALRGLAARMCDRWRGRAPVTEVVYVRALGWRGREYGAYRSTPVRCY